MAARRAASAPNTGAAVARCSTALPDAYTRLKADGARVLDVGCGIGWSTIAIGRAFPGATVVGLDLDEASIAEARDNPQRAGVADRVASGRVTRQRSSPISRSTWCACSKPCTTWAILSALRRIRAALAPQGVALVGDERVAESFTAPGDEIERFLYASSALHCVPATMAESPAVVNGTILREDTVRKWAQQAGYRSVEVLPVDNVFWRFYRLDP